MNNESLKLIEEICKKDISYIAIDGCSNPTYASEVFCLIADVKNKIQFGHQQSFSIINTSIFDWIKSNIEKIDPDYEIFKFKDMYIIGIQYGNDLPYEIEKDGSISVDYGGYIEIY